MPAGSTERAPTHRPPFPQTETVTVETYGPLKVACEYEAKGAFGNRAAIEFLEQGELMGIAMRHPNGGPEFGLRLDPARAEAAAGFDYFAIGVPSKEAIQDLAARLTALGDPHAGVHFATIGWILPELHDPDGHEVRFYTTAHHGHPVTASCASRTHGRAPRPPSARSRTAAGERRATAAATLTRATWGDHPPLRGVTAGSHDTEKILKLSYAA